METSPVQVDTGLSDYHMHDMAYMMSDTSPNPAIANFSSSIFSLTKCTKRIGDENKLVMSRLNDLHTSLRGITSEVEKANTRNTGLEASNRRLETRLQILAERWKAVNSRHTSLGQGMQDLERLLEAAEAQQNQGDKLLQVFETQINEAKGLYDQVEKEQASYKAKIDVQHEKFIAKCEKVKELTNERNGVKRENAELTDKLKDLQEQFTRETKDTAEEFAKALDLKKQEYEASTESMKTQHEEKVSHLQEVHEAELARKSQELQLQIEDKETTHKKSIEKQSKEFDKKLKDMEEKHQQKSRDLQQKTDIQLEEERKKYEKEIEEQASKHLQEKESYVADYGQKLSEMSVAKEKESKKLKDTLIEFENLKVSKEELNKQLKKSFSERQSIKRALDLANADNLKNKARGDQLQSAVDKKDARVKQLEEELGQKQQMTDSQIRVLEERISLLQQENIELQKSLTLERESDVENLNAEWQCKLDKSIAESTQKEEQIVNLEVEKARGEEAIKKLKNQVSSLESKLSKAQTELKSGASSKDNQVKKLEKEIAVKDKEIKSAQVSIKTKSRELGDLAQKVEDRDIQIQQLKSQLTQGWTASQVRSKEMEELENRIVAIQLEYENYKSETEKQLKRTTDQLGNNVESGKQLIKDEYERKVKGMEERVRKEQADHKETKERQSAALKEKDTIISKLEKLVEASNTKEKDLRHKTTSADKKFAQMQQELSALSQVRAENENMKKELNDLKAKAEIIQTRAENAIEEISNPISTDGNGKKNELHENKENRDPRKEQGLGRKRADADEAAMEKGSLLALNDDMSTKRARSGRSCIRRNPRRKPLIANAEQIGKPTATQQSSPPFSDLFEI